MKKALLIFLLMAAICQVKAQQFFPVKPADSLSNSILDKLTLKHSDQFKLFQPNSGLYQPLTFAATKNTVSNVDHMPIAVLTGNSKMPVVKLGGYYTMPVKKIGSEEVIPVPENAPLGLPTFSKP